jgi:hypothetical protein
VSINRIEWGSSLAEISAKLKEVMKGITPADTGEFSSREKSPGGEISNRHPVETTASGVYHDLGVSNPEAGATLNTVKPDHAWQSYPAGTVYDENPGTATVDYLRARDAAQRGTAPPSPTVDGPQPPKNRPDNTGTMVQDFHTAPTGAGVPTGKTPPQAASFRQFTTRAPGE